MKLFRSILPLRLLTLVLGFATIAAASVGFYNPHDEEPQAGNSVKLAFHPIPFDAHSSFACQVADGELEASDENGRQGSRVLMASGILLQSQTLSIQTILREQQLPRIPVPSGSLAILLNRLNI